MAAPAQLLSHIGSLEGDSGGAHYSRPWFWITGVSGLEPPGTMLATELCGPGVQTTLLLSLLLTL